MLILSTRMGKSITMQRVNIKRIAAVSAIVLVLAVFVVYQLYDIRLHVHVQREGNVKPIKTSNVKRKQKVSKQGNNLSAASDITFSSNEFNFDITHNSINLSAINVQYSEIAVTNMIEVIKKEAAKTLKRPQEKCKRRFPQCLIIGNFKCGTRELIDYMSMHPRIEIRNKPNYEISFFDKYYGLGLKWYRRNMPCSFSDQITVEKSPNYFHNVDVPARIHKMNSSIKLIALVREPVARTISWFTFWRSRMVQFHYNLDECVFKRPSGDINMGCRGVKESIYDEGIRRYLNFFDKSQIKIIEAEHFKRNPYNVLREIEEYLNIEHIIKPDNFVYMEQKGVYCLRQNKISQNVSCYGDSRGRNNTEEKNNIKYSNLTLHKLKNFFKPHNDAFFKQINKTFDW